MQELTPPRQPGRAHTHQIRAQVRKHARSQANKKMKKVASSTTHARTRREAQAHPHPNARGESGKGLYTAYKGCERGVEQLTPPNMYQTAFVNR